METSFEEILNTADLEAFLISSKTRGFIVIQHLMFPAPSGRPMQPRNLYSESKALLKRAELPNIRFHDLRHTAATLMLQQGVHPKVVSERLGHSDISMTLNQYSHVLPDTQDEAAEKLDELLTPIDVSDQIKKIGDKKPSHIPPRSRPEGNSG